ncbi:MAG: hypothetical protein H6817_07285 [Phycisphaerales bacterium]|nr:hypothetical protein [Phycisphaerales bacterium]
MDKWQQTFLGKLEPVKKHWRERFEQIAHDWIGPSFHEFDQFTTAHGFTVSSPDCDAGTRVYKFGLTENGYLLLAFRMYGLERVEAHTEIIVPGNKPVESTTARASLADVNPEWVRQQFRAALDRFVDTFHQACKSAPARAEAVAS